MVAIVSGNSLGLGHTSLATLGQHGLIGNPTHGRGGQAAFVNVATGNLVLQTRDDYVAARGTDSTVIRTYNSQGLAVGAEWMTGPFRQPLVLAGTLNSAGSTLVRTAADGAAASYAFDVARGAYWTAAGDGAYDVITFDAAADDLEWVDGATGARERYQASGSLRLLAATDTAGHGLTYGYDATGMLRTATTTAGDRTHYDYDSGLLKQLRTETASGSISTSVRYEYDTLLRLKVVAIDLSPQDNSDVDAATFRTEYVYDGITNRIVGVSQTDGSQLTLAYVQVGAEYRVASIQDALGNTTSFTYSFAAAGVAGFATVTDALGGVTRYDIDAAGQLTKITAPAGAGGMQSRQFSYSANGDLLSTTDGDGRVTTFAYDANGNCVLESDAAGNTVSRTYDAHNQQLTHTVHAVADPDGAGAASAGAPQTARHVYGSSQQHLLRFTISAEGRVTEHRYDGFGQRVASLTHAHAFYPVAGLSATDVPSEADLVAWAAAQDGTRVLRVDMSYDARGQLQTRTTYARTAADGQGVTDGTQSTEHYIHDHNGRLLQRVSAQGGATSFTYDGLGRQLTATDAMGAVTATQYLDATNRTIVTAANGLLTTQVHDRAGRLLSVQQSSAAAPNLGLTQYFHDAAGRHRMTQDAVGLRHWMLYDTSGRKVADIDGNGTLTEYAYTRSDLLAYQVTYATAVNTAALVDAAGLPVFTATLESIRPTANTGDVRLWRTYDAAQRLVREARTTGSGALAAVKEWRYDGTSRVVAVVEYASLVAVATLATGAIPQPAASPHDRSTRQFHDADGRLVATLDAEGFLSTFSYNAAGLQVEALGYATATPAAARATGTLAQLLPVASEADIRTVTLYDAKGQAIAEVDAEGFLTESVYDVNGNVATTVRYANRVTAAFTVSSTVAAIRPAASSADRATTRLFDAMNRLAQETDPHGTVTRYTYDSDGRLTATARAAATTEVRTLLARYDLQGRLVGELTGEGAALLTGGQTQAQVDAIWAQHGLAHGYDAASRRLSTTDAIGNRTFYYYNEDDALTHTINPLGEVQENRYDAQGRLTTQIAYASRISTTGLIGGIASPALLQSVLAVASSALDSRTTISYTASGAVASRSDAAGGATTYTYNAFGDEIGSSQAISTTDNLARTHTVDRRGLRTGTVTDAAGGNAIDSTVYDAFGRATRSVDANGRMREQAFDRLGRAVTTRDALGANRSTSYDAFGRVLTHTDALGHVTRYAYDKAARSITVTTPEGISTTTVHNRHGQVQSARDGKAQVTTYAYDRNGRLVQASTPLTTTSSTFDRAGRLLRTTDANGNQVAYTYDTAGRVATRTVDPEGLAARTSYAYDGKGQQVSVTDPNGVVTTIGYDREGQVLRQVVDPTGLNLITTYTYDARGRVLSVREPVGTLTQYAYDAMGRRIQERVDPDGLELVRSWAYDKNGNAVSSTDANGQVTRYAYDAAGRLTHTVDPLGSVRASTYDAEGRAILATAYVVPIAVGALGSNPTSDEIDALIDTSPGTDVAQFSVHDDDGRRVATVTGTGAVTRYTYDANGNVLTRVAYANRIAFAQWDQVSVPQPVADSQRDSLQVTVYDALDRPVYTMDGTGAVVAQAYDGNGNVVQHRAYAKVIPLNTPRTAAAMAAAVAAAADAARDELTRNTYDAAGRLAWSVDGIGAVTRFDYDVNGNVVRRTNYATAVASGASASSVATSASDRVTAMAYDAANRLVFQVDAGKAVTEQVFDRAGRVLRRTAYANALATVPAVGTPASVAAIRAALTASSTLDRSLRYGYDAAGRQWIAIDALGAVTRRQYDGVGNMVAVTAHANRLTASLPTTLTPTFIDDALEPDALADRRSRFAYDAAGRQVYAVDATGAVAATVYDGVGNVRSRTLHALPISASPTSAAAIAAAIQTGPNDRTELFVYNDAGQLTQSTDALGKKESFSYDGVGRKTSFVNRNQATWIYAYDAAGRMVQETSPLVELTHVAASDTGAVTAAAPVQAAIVTRLAYDALGRLTQRTEASGRPEQRVTEYEYDALGRQVRVGFPTVKVYAPAADTLASNGASGLAHRTEVPVDPETRTYYDVLGNAVAGRDVGGAISQKTYDAMGRVVHEVDALGYVTRYDRNGFGEVTALVRFGARTALVRNVTTAAQAVTLAQAQAALSAVGFSHAEDRTLLSAYDRAGRLVKTTEPTAYVYHYSVAEGGNSASTGKTTNYVYNAFGEQVEAITPLGIGEETGSTTRYYDKAGREVATVDAMGYLTTRTYDAFGNLLQEKEYARALVAGQWTRDTYGAAPAALPEDRTTEYLYDRLNRKTRETRLNVEFSTGVNGTSTRGPLSTTYAWDAVGNQTAVTNAAGHTTFTYYDALGRIEAIAEPLRATTSGSRVPLTAFGRDAHGNAVLTREYAQGATAATASTFTTAAHADDRVTTAAFDGLGRRIQVTDAEGHSQYFSYDAHGNVAKQWQAVTDLAGVTRTVYQVNTYDKVGRLVGTVTPGPSALTATGTDETVATAMEYNAFGEMVRKGAQGVWHETFAYDTAGRLWRTNAGDGVVRINLYDLQGNITAEIRSSGVGRDNIDLLGFASAQAAAANPYTRRTDISHDALGRVSARVEAARREDQGGVTIQRQYITATALQSATPLQNDGDTPQYWSGSNQVTLGWNSLAALGSGDIKVVLDYLTPVKVTVIEEADGAYTHTVTSGGVARSEPSKVLDGAAAASGLTMSWGEETGTKDGGIGEVTRIRVYKKDALGTWRTVIDEAPGYGANVIDLAAPTNPDTVMTLQLRVEDSAGDTGWFSAGLRDYGNSFRYDATGLAPGNYEYRVQVTPPGESTHTSATGTLAVTLPPLAVITKPITYGQSGQPAGMLAWNTPGVDYEQVLHYRAAGSTGAWTALAVKSRTATLDGVDTSALAAGTYQFELLWTPAGQSGPSSHATGTFTVVAAKPATTIPAVNLPHITGLAHAGSGASASLSWNAAGANVARYQLADGTWKSLAINNTLQSVGTGESSGWIGVQKVALPNLAPGSYRIEIQSSSPPAQATATLTIYAKPAGRYETRTVSVATQVPQIIGYSPVYETRTGTRQVQYTVWVACTPYIVGYDEAGQPIWASQRKETRTKTETYTYQVQVGQKPVYARDESGNIIYQTVYVQQQQQVWVEGVAPAPKLAITTPPYTPSKIVAAVPKTYSVKLTTVAGSTALSTSDGGLLAQTPELNGEKRWLRPTVLQKTDRWGNVLEITDPRSAYWKTTYKYNASNQMVLQTQPTTTGAAGGPVTSIYYDLLGRQIATKDARGYITAEVWDAGGNLMEQRQADGGVVRHSYSVLGDKVKTTDAEANAVTFSYDKLGRMTRMVKGEALVYSASAGNTSTSSVKRAIAESWEYDQLGQKLSHTNGNNEKIRYSYDLRGNLVQTMQPLGQAVRAAYDAQGHKVAEVDANGHTATWTYDYFGMLEARTDLGGAIYNFTYDHARQMVAQTNNRGQNITYAYDAAGQVTQIKDIATGKTTTYAYDMAGRRVREKVQHGSVVYQDNQLSYDARGQLRDVADGRVHISMEYDDVGNRTRIATRVNYQGVQAETTHTANRYFLFDEMNRQRVVDAVDAAGNISQTQGHELTYDHNGNRTSDKSWGNRVIATGGERVLTYDESGAAQYVTTMPIDYETGQGYVTEKYTYDNLNRLQGVEREAVQIDLRRYDGADRVILSGPKSLPTGYTAALNAGVAPGESNGQEIRINRYDANGRLLQQRIRSSAGKLLTDISWDKTQIIDDSRPDYVANGYDQAGNVLGYVVHDYANGNTEYTTQLGRAEGYQELKTSVKSTFSGSGSNTQQYDVNGHLVGIDDATQGENDRTFVNDAAGRALFVRQGGHVRRQMIANGEVLGMYGVGVDPVNPLTGKYNNPNFTNTVDFDFGYARVSASYPSASPGVYHVQQGDTLQGIAQASYGDSSLWYRIADANGLASSTDLKVGQTLTIPNRVGTISNNSSTFKPYDPGRIVGDTTPHMAMPKGDGGCGGVGKLVMVIVAVVVTVMTGGALGYVLGSIASQAVGLATGTIDKFSWKSVALSAVAGGVSGAIGGLGIATAVSEATGSAFVGAAAQAVAANVITQGISVATGLQKKFDWRGVAAAGIGAGVGQAVGEALGVNGADFQRSGFGERVLRSGVTALAAGATTSVLRGGRVNVVQVAVDAFGNALGSSLAENSHGAMLTTSVRFPNADNTFAGTQASGELPDLASMDALNRQIAEGYEPPALDPADGVVVAGTERIGLGFRGRTAIIGAPTTTQEMLETALADAMALKGQYAGAAARAANERGLQAMQQMADAYRASGMTGATGDVMPYDPPMPLPVAEGPAGAARGSSSSDTIQAVESTVWEQVWGAPQVQHVVGNTISGKLLGGVFNFFGTGVSAVRADGYNPATLKYVHGVNKQRALQDTVIGLAIMPLGGTRSIAMRADVATARIATQAELSTVRVSAQAEVTSARGTWIGKQRFDATNLSDEDLKIATTKSVRRHMGLGTDANGQLIANVNQTETLLQKLTSWRRSVYANDPDFLALDANMQGTIIHSSVSNRMRQLNVADLRINERLYGTTTNISPVTGQPYTYRIPDYYHVREKAILDIKPAGTPLSGAQYDDFRGFAGTNDVLWIYYQGFR